jgi:16S rRNA processing protein RimM
VAGDELTVGVIGKPVGIRGEAHVHPDPDLDHDFAPGTTYPLPGGGTLTVASTRLHGGRRVVRFAEAPDRPSVVGLRGTELRVPRSRVPLGEDRFWSADLLGREVLDPSGELIGIVEGTLDGPAHDYVVVARTDGGEVLVPAVAELLEITDSAIVVRTIPGLLDDGEER